ncbi:beta-microseminoprotein-like [Bufo bufo]|uniref:beta-microseminoprotein-like n=1 Tax=Bufo bufo TaxID=8384 RepID=UPI001ABE9BA3|nr:beta-microseminoprotein-like [Bufo bufo]
MKVLLALGVVLAVSVALSSAFCSKDLLKLDLKTRQAACEEGGKQYKIGSTWTSRCMSCSCSKTGMTCCSLVNIPSDYDKENCVAILDEETCSYRVTKKDNPSEECEVKAMVG